MPAISLHKLCWSTPDGRELFDSLDLTFGSVRTGLIGRNGTGKSTLLKLIAGDLTPRSGAVSMTGTLGVLTQSVQVDDTISVADALGIAGAISLLDRIERGECTEDDFARADWALEERMRSALDQLGLPTLAPARLVSTLSGGQRTRLALARLVLDQPDIILLDEPTNNLDADGRQAVGEVLRGWRGGAIVVSHDRALLNEMDSIVELTSLGATTYGGNWEHYAERKAVELAVVERDLASAERQVADVDRKAQSNAEKQARRDAGGKRKAAKGDLPRILLGVRRESAERTSGESARLSSRLRESAAQAASDARARIEILTPLSASLMPTGLPSGRTVLQVDELTGGPAADVRPIRDLSFAVVGAERVAITGPNGAGKTTLLRLLTGELTATAGTARIMVPYALLDQTVSLLDPALSIRDNFRRHNPDADENTVRAALARFMFRADAALQIAGTLSGGQMLRAGLAVTIGGNTAPQLLILDEPTNHLDLAAIEELEAGLSAYDGALLVVSHDRSFLEAIGVTREIVLGGG